MAVKEDWRIIVNTVREGKCRSQGRVRGGEREGGTVGEGGPPPVDT